VMSRRFRRFAGKVAIACLAGLLVYGLVPSVTLAGFPVSLEESLARRDLDGPADQPPFTLLYGGDEEQDRQGASDEAVRKPSGRSRMIIGGTLLGSGIFLCSWGITAWEIEEYQCCPARNTGNVVKIVAGVVLINAGLIHLLGEGD
jgi:hypothetical protein